MQCGRVDSARDSAAALSSRPVDTLGYLLLWLLFAPLGVTLYQGQSSLFLFLLYALAFISLKRGEELRAGLYLGVGLFKF